MVVTCLIGGNNLAWDRIFSLTRPADLATMLQPRFHGHALSPGNEDGDTDAKTSDLKGIYFVARKWLSVHSKTLDLICKSRFFWTSTYKWNQWNALYWILSLKHCNFISLIGSFWTRERAKRIEQVKWLVRADVTVRFSVMDWEQVNLWTTNRVCTCSYK